MKYQYAEGFVTNTIVIFERHALLMLVPFRWRLREQLRLYISHSSGDVCSLPARRDAAGQYARSISYSLLLKSYLHCPYLLC